jgi:DNA repair protein RadC
MIYLQDSKITVQSPREVAKVFYDLLLLEDKIDQEKEHFYVMHLDTRSRINMVELVSLGTLTSSLVHPRETFRRAVLQGSASIIVAHNHPSGEVDPSNEDTKVTKLLFEAGNILGITMLDHLIFAKGIFYSFRDSSVRPMTEGEGRGEYEYNRKTLSGNVDRCRW